jgi:hypothetical protein
MNAATAVTANFRTQYLVTTELDGLTSQAGGLVDSSPAGVACLLQPSILMVKSCDTYFDAGTTVTLIAEPGQWTFLGWGRACTGLGTCTLTLNGDVQVLATFAFAPPPDTYGKSLGNATGLGTINCNESISRSGAISPAGSSDWFVLDLNVCAGGGALLTITSSGNIVFDLVTSPSSNVVLDVPLYTSLTTSGVYYIRIHGATPTTTGTWTLSISA